MKDNKGFTLVELIVTIGLMAALSVVIGLSTMNMMARQREKEYEEFKTKLENAACVYAETDANCKNPKSCNVTYESLITNGLIDKDLMNPDTDKNPDKLRVSDTPGKTIEVKWENNEKICTYEE